MTLGNFCFYLAYESTKYFLEFLYSVYVDMTFLQQLSPLETPLHFATIKLPVNHVYGASTLVPVIIARGD